MRAGGTFSGPLGEGLPGDDTVDFARVVTRALRERARATDRRAEVHEALAAYHDSRDEAALNFIVSAYQGLARSLANRFVQRGEDIDDLNQVALIGLLKADRALRPRPGGPSSRRSPPPPSWASSNATSGTGPGGSVRPGGCTTST